MKIQPRLGYARKNVGAGVSREIERAINRTTARFAVSRSFVIAVALAEQFGIALDHTQDYRKTKRR